ncbi:hypothetical protein HanIR_Chr09g0432771 [Helianthus annuus]|nr:hypothetical protein HanIR_Chr09g0432771 [Helianthus annuus]
MFKRADTRLPETVGLQICKGLEAVGVAGVVVAGCGGGGMMRWWWQDVVVRVKEIEEDELIYAIFFFVLFNLISIKGRRV